MQTNLNRIHKELSKYKDDYNRIKYFNQYFIKILKDYYYQIEYVGCLFKNIIIQDRNGVIKTIEVLDYAKFTGLMDKTGLSYRYYSEEEHEFTSLPSKEFLLLAIVAIGMHQHTDEILGAAGYSTYMKNLNEFIIFVGLKNNQSFDIIRDKLIDYGFRGDKAIDSELYFNNKKIDRAETFYHLLYQYCEKKRLKPKKVLKETGFYSIRWDAEKNRYYYEAFTGKSDTAFHLTNEQCFRLFLVLNLTKEEQIDFAKQLEEHHFLIEGEEEFLIELIEEGVPYYMKQPTEYNESDDLQANDISVRTKYINQQLETTSWAEIDSFIQNNFSNIRSFALFFEDVLQYEGVNLNNFVLRTGLAKSALYDYKMGLAIPDMSRLTVIASLIRRLNIYIYFTFLKKAGKFEFGKNTESPLIMMMQRLLENKKDEEILFGHLFDLIEKIINEDEEIVIIYQELLDTYIYQCETIARQFRKVEQSPNISKILTDAVNKIKFNKNMDKIQTVSTIIKTVSNSLPQKETEDVIVVLKIDYGFSEISSLIDSIESLSEKELEV